MKISFALRNASGLSSFLDWTKISTFYVHWPYCLKRCSYCNFNKYIKEDVNHDLMQNCLTKEAETLIRKSEVREIKSIFFGGGTPSLAIPDTISKVIQKIASLTYLDKNAEVTLECNPTRLESGKLQEFKAAGVNRVSIGVQTLDDKGLEVLGRTHSTRDSLNCIENACQLFPGKVSVDLIFGRPEQTLSQLEQEIKQVLSFCDNHISLYQLTLERGTELFKRFQNNELILPNHDLQADMYLLAIQILEENGFMRYEVSNFARKGAESHHNRNYWNGTQYIGIGPGAHGRFHVPESLPFLREARIQTLGPDVWMSEVQRRGHGTRKVVPQGTIQILEELLMTSMRTVTGLTPERWNIFSKDASIGDVFGSSSVLNKLVQEGLCHYYNGSLVPTLTGMTMADTLTTQLLPVIQEFQFPTKWSDSA